MSQRKRKKSIYAQRIALAVDHALFGPDPLDNLMILANAARRSAAFGAVDFDAAEWTDVKVKKVSPSRGRRIFTFHFGRLPPGEPSTSRANRIPMSQEMALLAKSVLRLSEDARPYGNGAHNDLLAALRMLDLQLMENGRLLRECETEDLYETQRRYEAAGAAPSTTEALGKTLAKVAYVLNAFGLTDAYIEYIPLGRRVCPDDEPDDVRLAKLPTKAAMKGIKYLASVIGKMPERFRIMTWTVMLMCLIAVRVSEILLLPADCEVFADAEDRPKTESDWRRNPDKIRYGLRYFDMKIGRDAIKWVKSDAVMVVRAIIAKVRAITELGRLIAAEVEATGRPILPEGLADRQLLTMRELGRVLGSTPYRASKWVRNNGIPKIRPHLPGDEVLRTLNQARRYKTSNEERLAIVRAHLVRSPYGILTVDDMPCALGITYHPSAWAYNHKLKIVPVTVRRADVEREMLRMYHHPVPEDFPVRLSELLFVFPARYFASRPLPVGAKVMTLDNLRLFLTGGANTSGIFEMLGREEPDGSPIYLTSTMLRRRIITLARKTGLSVEQTARMAGHKTLKAQAPYDQRSGSEKRAGQREMLTQMTDHLGIEI